MGKASSKPQSPTRETPALRNDLTEDALQTLRRFDTVILVDDSGSMIGHRWKEAGKALMELASVAGQYDQDGIEIHFINSTESRSGVRDSTKVEALFRSVKPHGRTPLGTRLTSLLEEYYKRLESNPQSTKPVNFIVITDGAPTDNDETERGIIKYAKALDAKNARVAQMGIQFVQIGDDPDATAFLKKLDDDLPRHGIRDIVDTTHAKGKLDLVKILLGAINRRVDNKGSVAVISNT